MLKENDFYIKRLDYTLWKYRLSHKYNKLQVALQNNRTNATCHKYWREFIIARDGYKCISCNSQNELNLAAHHIVRKSFMNELRFQPGNGITLCKQCHHEVHAGFNGKPNLGTPMDYEGGEKIETIGDLFEILYLDASSRNVVDDYFYFISDHALGTFKLFQGFKQMDYFSGYRLFQAVSIWKSPEQHSLNAVFNALDESEREYYKKGTN